MNIFKRLLQRARDMRDSNHTRIIAEQGIRHKVSDKKIYMAQYPKTMKEAFRPQTQKK